MIPFFQELTGINVIMFYTPVLLMTIGFVADASLMSAVTTGGVNAIATVVSIYYVDKLGIRLLFLEGGVQMLFCQMQKWDSQKGDSMIYILCGAMSYRLSLRRS